MSRFLFSDILAVLYGYTYGIVAFTIITTSYHVASKIKLLPEFYDLINNIHKNLGIITIVVNAFDKKIKKLINGKNPSHYSFVDAQNARIVVNQQFDKIITLINTFRSQTLHQIDSIDQQAIKYNLRRLPTRSYEINEINDNEEKKAQVNEIYSNHDSSIDDYDNTKHIELQSAFHVPKNLANDSISTIINTDETMMAEIHQIQSPRVLMENIEQKIDDYNTQKRIKQLNDYISKKLLAHKLMNKRGFEAYIHTLLEIRKIIIMVVSHFLDISSDIAVAWEWYILWQKQNNGNEPSYLKKVDNIDMKVLFLCCISVIIYYRIASAYKVYIFTRSKMDTFLQFTFDFYLLKLIYVNIVKMHSYKPLDIIQIYRGIEGSHESAYQAILAMVFLIKTNFNNDSSTTSIVSLIFSLWSLSSRFINLDKYFVKSNATVHGIKWKDIKHYGILFVLKNEFNLWYVYHILFRTFETTFSIILLSLIWIQFGELIFGIVLLGLAICVVLANMIFQSRLQTSFWENVLLNIYTDFLKSFLSASLAFLAEYQCNCNDLLCCFTMFFVSWIFWVRFVVLCIIGWFVLFDSSIATVFTDAEFDNVSILVIGLFIFQFVLIGMSIIACKNYFGERYEHEIPKYINDGFKVISQIERNDRKNLSFMKRLGVELFLNSSAVPTVLLGEIMQAESPKVLYEFYSDWYKECYGLDQRLMSYFISNLGSSGVLTRIMRGWSLYDTQSKEYRLKMYKILLEHGFDMTVKTTSKDQNILHVACWELNLDEVRWILENNIVDINDIDGNKDNALHCAANSYVYKFSMNKESLPLYDVCQLLIQHGIDTQFQNQLGQTAKEVLIFNGCLTLAEMLCL